MLKNTGPAVGGEREMLDEPRSRPAPVEVELRAPVLADSVDTRVDTVGDGTRIPGADGVPEAVQAEVGGVHRGAELLRQESASRKKADGGS